MTILTPSPAPHPDDPRHANLEARLQTFLEENGFLVASSGYHDVYPDEIKKRLQRMYTRTALYLRGRTDKLAIHASKTIAFLIECKTRGNGAGRDFIAEAMPLLHHIGDSDLGVYTLYAWHHEGLGIERGFWISPDCDPPLVSEIWIPSKRWTPEAREWWQSVFRSKFPSAKIQTIDRTAGSDDPFLVIPEATMRALPSWQDLIMGTTDEKT